jgi:hypothetical protein
VASNAFPGSSISSGSITSDSLVIVPRQGHPGSLASRYNNEMGIVQPGELWTGRRRGLRALGTLRLTSVLLACLSLPACDALRLLDTDSLDRAGMSYDAIKELKSLHISQAEINEVAKVRRAGLPDSDCVTLLRVSHLRNQPFTDGEAIAGLYQSGLTEGTVMGLANLDQVGMGSGELQAMHLAGLPDDLILGIARDRANGKSTLSGAALGTMRNLRIDNSTLLQLVQRGTPESDGPRIIADRRRGAKDSDILRHFPSVLN